MKKLIFILALFFASDTGFAQKCNYNVNEKDAATGALNRKILVTVRSNFLVWTNNLGGKKSLGFEIVFPDIKRELIKKGDTLVVIMPNDDFIYLRASEEAQPAGKSDEKAEITNYYPNYELTDAEWDRLCAGNVKAIQMHFSGTLNLWEFTDKEGKKITEAAKCVK